MAQESQTTGGLLARVETTRRALEGVVALLQEYEGVLGAKSVAGAAPSDVLRHGLTAAARQLDDLARALDEAQGPR
jgi:hypothetical protein